MGQHPEFETQDLTGLTTLQNLTHADRFNKWMFDAIRPYVSGKILEIGSGIGNISAQFIKSGLPITLTDFSPQYCQLLHQRFDIQPLVQSIHQMDLANPAFASVHAPLLGRFDTVFALNVVEHIENHERAIANAHSLLAPGGKIIILVPAYQSLYNGLDTALGHFRRYTRKSLSHLLESQGFTVTHTQNFNLAGIFGWFFTGSLQKQNTLPAGQLKLYNKLVPLFRLADTLTGKSMGLSVIAIGQKSNSK
jgi:2-polyprenyl-3-methyl-5-hydroxy-6-metoxy-1,4-benzoquinol methylase